MAGTKFGILGPDGTFSAEAGVNYCTLEGFSPDIHWMKGIKDCFSAVDSGIVEMAIVPILNSTVEASWINTTLKHLRDNSAMISGEYVLNIRHNLLVLPGTTLGDIRYVHSKDKAIEQSGIWLRENLPQFKPEYEDSTAAAAEKVRSIGDKSRAALATMRAAELYGLESLARGIQDSKKNKTKFVVIGKRDHIPTGNDKTSLIFEFHDSGIESILDMAVLDQLRANRVNKCYINSVPKDGELDDFTFYVDVRGHRTDSNVAAAIDGISNGRLSRHLSYFRVLGSYPVHEYQIE